jgi:hypothetical protein
MKIRNEIFRQTMLPHSKRVAKNDPAKPEDILEELKALGNKRDVPYHNLALTGRAVPFKLPVLFEVLPCCLLPFFAMPDWRLY